MSSLTRSNELPASLRRLAGPLYSERLVSLGLLSGESLLCALIIRKVAYTEIDWTTYMQQVKLYWDGERDYGNLRGDTGPLVYPAGHVYAYSALRTVSDDGRDVRRAQQLFAGLYVATQAVVLALYTRSRSVPLYALPLLVLSKRLHSIYVLRLFNEGIAMLPFYLALLLAVRKRWRPASVLYSLALSVKMNMLLYAPILGLLIVLDRGLSEALGSTAIVALVQILLALPFLLVNPQAYLSRAFDLSRVFLYRWTVNWRFLSESTFLAATFSSLLLVAHAVLLLMIVSRIGQPHGGIVSVLRRCIRQPLQGASRRPLRDTDILTALFAANLVGILCARSLHYQFYAWYAQQLVFLLWQTSLSIPIRLALLGAIEWSWNVFPSTTASSLVLLAAHVTLIGALLRSIGSETVDLHAQ